MTDRIGWLMANYFVDRYTRGSCHFLSSSHNNIVYIEESCGISKQKQKWDRLKRESGVDLAVTRSNAVVSQQYFSKYDDLVEAFPSQQRIPHNIFSYVLDFPLCITTVWNLYATFRSKINQTLKFYILFVFSLMLSSYPYGKYQFFIFLCVMFIK